MTATAKRATSRDTARRRTVTALACAAVLLLPLAWSAQTGGAFFIPGDPQAGLKTFFDKGCARCHAVLGEGGATAPDLARAPAGHLGASEIVAEFWNHAPAMWETMRAESVELPPFSETEMANLFAFLYSVRALDDPGNPERGRRLLAEKKCIACHALGGEGGRAAPDLRKWSGQRNAVSWVQAMWNHAPAMQASMQARGLDWPQFSGTDVTDLLAYIRSHASGARGRMYLRPGNPAAGRALFGSKGCAQCHGLAASGGRPGPDLGQRRMPRTLGQFAAAMWNHAPAMAASMQARQIQRPQFSNEEMADLIAYLFAERYFERTANAARGARLFEAKGCAACHAPGSGAPDLAGGRANASPAAIATALWNHGPLMLERMRELRLDWPRFAPGEMADLMEFLGNGQPPARAERTGSGKR